MPQSPRFPGTMIPMPIATVTDSGLMSYSDYTSFKNNRSTVGATITANYTTVATDYYLPCDATTGNLTVTFLPAASALANGRGQEIVIKKIDATVNTVSFTADGATITLSTQNSAIHLISNGTTYTIIGDY